MHILNYIFDNISCDPFNSYILFAISKADLLCAIIIIVHT